ncbi:hypothetical protein FOZ62_028433, partial [Perkinsus olseni]
VTCRGPSRDTSRWVKEDLTGHIANKPKAGAIVEYSSRYHNFGVSVPPLTLPIDGNCRVHHSNVSAEVMVKTIDQLINDLGKKSIPVQNAPEHELFISRCITGDALDTPDQCFKFEIDWPMEASLKAPWDSTRMINSLAANLLTCRELYQIRYVG